MKMKQMWMVFLTTFSLLAATLELSQAAFDSGSTGVDRALDVASGTVELQLPPDGVFNFTTVNVQTGATLKFLRNAQNTPVTILASGNVVIAGTIDVSGNTGSSMVPGDGGPGGFDGGVGAGVGQTGRRGEGPGGGLGGNPSLGGYAGGGGGGSFKTVGTTGYSGYVPGGTGGVIYGNDWLLPLIGGSGGGGGGAGTTLMGGGGGGGGGALLIASSGTIDIKTTGMIAANGGVGGKGGSNYGGSGGGGAAGSVRLIANTISGAGIIKAIGGIGGNNGSGATGGTGGKGRVRFEATVTYTGSSDPAFVMSYPYVVNLPNMPSLRIVSIAGVNVPDVPGGDFGAPDVILPYTTRNPLTVVVQGTNIPLGTQVIIQSNPAVGSSFVSSPVPLAGTEETSVASLTLNISTAYPSVLTASVTYQALAANGGPIFINGERVELVRVATTLGGASQVTYVTEHGREIPATL